MFAHSLCLPIASHAVPLFSALLQCHAPMPCSFWLLGWSCERNACHPCACGVGQRKLRKKQQATPHPSLGGSSSKNTPPCRSQISRIRTKQSVRVRATQRQGQTESVSPCLFSPSEFSVAACCLFLKILQPPHPPTPNQRCCLFPKDSVHAAHSTGACFGACSAVCFGACSTQHWSFPAPSPARKACMTRGVT